jgi:hypothetical protein
VVRYVLLATLVGVVLLAVVGAVLLRHQLSDTTATDTLSASTVSKPSAPSRTSGATQSANVSIRTDVGLARGNIMTVAQHVRFDRPVATLRLAVPERSTSVSGGEFSPRVRNFHIVLSNHSPLRLHMTVKPGDEFTITLPHPASRFDLVYAALGAVRRSQPSSAHRALALVTLVTMSPADLVTNTIRFNGANVTNLGCIQPSGTAIACGAQTPDGWSVTQNPGEQDVAIVAQLDLH